jgi:hypothetical protein
MTSRRLSLMEAAHFVGLLTENQRIDFLRKTYGEKANRQFSIERDGGGYFPAELSLDDADMGDRVIAYIVSRDPSTNKSFSQWLVTRYCSGSYRIEDLESRIPANLALFTRAKPRLEKRDINQYPDVAALESALDPFRENVPVTANQEKRLVRQRLRNDDQVEFIYDSPELSISSPKTFEAACYYGRNTKWCTTETQERFDQYAKDGKLYIILDKKNNRRWQFHFATSQFMDETDTRVDLRSFFHEYPRVFTLFGEDAWLPYVKDLGVDFFSPEALERLDKTKLARSIKSIADFDNVPQHIRENAYFVKELLRYLYLSDQEAKAYVKHVIQSLNDDTIWTMVCELVSEKQRGDIFKYLPNRFLTDENKKTIVTIMVDNGFGFQAIDAQIPKPWSVEVENTYWTDRLKEIKSPVFMREMPKRFRTTENIIKVLSHTPQNINECIEYLTPAIATKVGENTIWIYKQNDLPDEYWRNPKFAAMLWVRWVKPTHNMNGTAVYNGLRKHASEFVGDYWMLFKKFPPALWPAELVPYMFAHGEAAKISWKDFPRNHKTDENIDAWLAVKPAGILEMPKKELTPDRVVSVINRNVHGGKELFAKMSDLIDEDLMIRSINEGSSWNYVSDPVNLVPHGLRTPGVYNAMMDNIILPISEVPPKMLTKQYALVRVKRKLAELKDVPANMFDEEFAASLVEYNSRNIEQIPQRLYSEELLYNYLNGTESSEEYFIRFPKTMWSKRVIALAIQHGFINEDAVSDDYLDEAGAANLLIKNPESIKRVPAEFLTDNVLSNAVSANPDVIGVLSEDQLSEPVIYAALARWASGYKDKYSGTRMEMIDLLPVSKWSQRCWEEAVGYIKTLKDVPANLRNLEIVQESIKRDPQNLNYLKEPTSWLNENSDKIEYKAKFDHAWNENLADLGIVKSGGKYKDARLLEKRSLESGGSSVIMKIALNKYQIFVFDEKGKIIGRVATEKGRFVVPYVLAYKSPFDLEKIKKQLAETIEGNETINDFNKAELLKFGITSKGVDVDLPRRKSSDRDKMEWSSAPYSDPDQKIHSGTVVYGWLNSKKVIEYVINGARMSYRVETCKVLSPKAVHRLNSEIIKSLDRQYARGSWNHALHMIGIDNDDGVWVDMKDKKIMETTDVEVYRRGSTISIFSKTQGLLARGTVLKSGKISKVQVENNNINEDAVLSIFSKIQETIPA